jgi:hypothetical protein
MLDDSDLEPEVKTLCEEIIDKVAAIQAWFTGFGVFLGSVFWRAGTLSVRPTAFHGTHRKA